MSLSSFTIDYLIRRSNLFIDYIRHTPKEKSKIQKDVEELTEVIVEHGDKSNLELMEIICKEGERKAHCHRGRNETEDAVEREIRNILKPSFWDRFLKKRGG